MTSTPLSSSGIPVTGVGALRHHEERWLAAVATGDEHVTRRAWLAPLAEPVLEAGLEHLLVHGPDHLIEELLPLLPATLDWNRLVTKALATNHAEVLQSWLHRCDLKSPSCGIVQEAVRLGDRPVVRQVLEELICQASGTSPAYSVDWRSLVSVAMQWATELGQDEAVLAMLPLDDDGRLADRVFKQAVRLGNLPLVKRLQPGRSLETCQVAMLAAVEDGQADMAEHLLPHIHFAVHPINLLEPAVRNEHEAVVRVLLPHVDPHLFKSVAIARAMEIEDSSILECLLEHAKPSRLPVEKLHQAVRLGCDPLLDWAWPHVTDPLLRQRVMQTAVEEERYEQVTKRLSEDEVRALGQELLVKRAWKNLDGLAIHVHSAHVEAWFLAVPAEWREQLPNLSSRHLAHLRAQSGAANRVDTARPRRRT